MIANHQKDDHLPPPSEHLAHPTYRPDIDGLRAVAVLAVVAFHASPNWVTGGFVGVDIFFVISGYLISTIIVKSLEQSTFSFIEFYSRRVRRIFPALLVVLISCYAFGWFVLFADEYKGLGKHVAAGAGFVSNLVLWGESGYFDAAAETKPLLHLWSLGIEEQFYLIWPLVLWLGWKRNINPLTITIIASVISFALNLAKYQSDVIADFYSPQTRFWELLAGALFAYYAQHKKSQIREGSLSKLRHGPAGAGTTAIKWRWADGDFRSTLGGVLIVVAMLAITKERHFPGIWALLPVLATVLIISAGQHAWLNRNVLSNPILVWFGLISFPLYLWHWPLLSIARIIEGEMPARSIRVGAVVLSILFSWVTYKIVEHPLRFGGFGKGKSIILVTLMAIVGLLGLFTYSNEGFPTREYILESEAALSQTKWPDSENADTVCMSRMKYKYQYCRLGEDGQPTVALIGDSFANSYFQGLSDEYRKIGDRLIMLGAGGCPPFLDITSGLSGHADWCKSMSSDALRHVAKLSSIHTVILAGNWHLYINGTRFYRRYDNPWEIRKNGGDVHNQTNVQVFSEKMAEVVKFLINSEKNVVIIKQTPELSINPAACLINRQVQFFEREHKCRVSSDSVKSYLSEYERVFDPLVQDYPGLRVVDPYPIFCPRDECIFLDGIYPLYRDDIHLSLYGSRYLASRLQLN